MKKYTHQLIAMLCESIITEASTAIDIVKNNPESASAKKVIQYLHQHEGLDHNQSFVEVEKGKSLSNLMNSVGFLILVGERGAASIFKNKSYQSSYSVVLGDPPTKLTSSRIDECQVWIKQAVGKINKIYFGRPTQLQISARADRASRSSGTNKTIPRGSNAFSYLVQKLQPLLIKLVEQAMADVKGVIYTLIDHGNLGRAREKIHQLQVLNDIKVSLLDGDYDESRLKQFIEAAYEHTVDYYYGGEQVNRYSDEMTQGSIDLINHIYHGDRAKLGTFLGFFKRALLLNIRHSTY